uniref:Protoporphyrinogen oxidase n=1 Tax=Culicoides sonorensis TaxID=179676 RepID=A0A336KLR4_CULSO
MSTTVIGAGIGGLAAAHYIKKGSIKPIQILEASERVGGWINSKNYDEGFIFEAGPRTIRPRGIPGANTLELIEEIGLSSDVVPISSAHVAARNRMIFANGQLCLLPNSLSSIFKKSPPFSESLANIILNDLKKGVHKKLEDESIYDFVKRRFGQELADYAISPMICGICAGNAKEISVNFLMKEIFAKEQKYGGIIKGVLMSIIKGENKKPRNAIILQTLANRAKNEYWSIYSLNGGLEKFPRKFADFLVKRDIKIKLQTPVEKITFHKDNVIELTSNGETQSTDYVVSSIPSYQLANTIESQHPILAKHLNSIPNVDVAVLNFQYNDPNLIKQPGFGVLVPPIENLPVLGIIFDSCCFSMPNHTVLTVMMGGHWFKKLFGDDPAPEKLVKIAQENIERILGISAEPNMTKVNILRKCIPQYTIGHVKRVIAIRDYIKENNLPLSVCGASYDGVGVNDVILSAREAAKAIWV